MELLLVIPLAAAAAGLYWMFKPPHEVDNPSEIPEQAPATGMPIHDENTTGAVATVHAAPVLMQNSRE